MSIIMVIETSYGERLHLLSSDKQSIGYWMANFLIVLDNYCSGVESTQWLAPLDQYMNGELCERTKSIRSAYYSGYWDFQPDEFEFFQKRTGDKSLTEAKFKDTVRFIRRMWTDIDDIIDIANELLKALDIVKIQEKAGLYNEFETSVEIKTFLDTLNLLKERGAVKVRLNIV